MSWWESASGFTTLASHALKTAQQRIDKVLDIKQEEGSGVGGQAESIYEASSPVSSPAAQTCDNDLFFESYLGTVTPPSTSSGKPSERSHSEQSSVDHDQSKKSTELSLKDKLQKKRAAREAQKMTGHLVETKSTTEATESRFQVLGSHPQSAFSTPTKDAHTTDTAEEHTSDDHASEQTEDTGAQRLVASAAEEISNDELPSSCTDVKPDDVTDGSISCGVTLETYPEDRTSPACDGSERDTESVISDEAPVMISKVDNIDSETEKTTIVTEMSCSEESPSKTTEDVCITEDVGGEIPTPTEVKNIDILESDDIKDGQETVEVPPENVDDMITNADLSGNSDSGSVGLESGDEGCSQGSMPDTSETGWDDASLSILGLSQMNVSASQHVSDSNNETAGCVDGSGSKMESDSAVLSTSPDVVSLSESLDAAPSDFVSSTTTDPCMEAVQRDDNELETSTLEADSCDKPPVTPTETPEIKSLESSTFSLPYLTESLGKDLEESSETLDELSESNRTLTTEDVENAKRDSEIEGSTTDKFETVSDDTEESDTGDGEPVVEETTEQDGDKRTADTSNKTVDSSQLSSSSYVRNLLEEAMTESVKDTDSHSSSDMVRIESGHTSGHTSADEIDTTTSSDIEIISHISTPTSNGDGQRIERPFDLSPLRHAFRSTRRSSPPGHRRSDSSSSGHSLYSRNGEDGVGTDLHTTGREATGGALMRSHDTESSDSSNPLGTEKLLKTNYDNRDLAKKLADVSEVLDAREKRLVSLSQENMELVEANTILRSQLQQAEEAREAEMEDLSSLSDEFTLRISEAEKKIQTAVREKEAMKRKLQETEAELLKRADKTVTDKQLMEKEQIIAELMEEGEKLSKHQLQSNNILKKLRAKEKENETTIKSLTKKLDEQKTEIENLQKVLDSKVEMEQNQSDAIVQLNAAVKRQETELLRSASELEDANEKCRSMKVALDNSYKEMSELHKAKATSVSEAQKAALSAEVQVKEEVRLAMDEYQHQARNQQLSLLTQLEDTQLCMSRMEKEHGRREDLLRQEISDLQQRLQEAEGRNQELCQSVTAATRPLLRQIENLQAMYKTQSKSYENVEKSLTERLTESQNQLAVAVERERLSGEKVLESTTRLASLESQVSSLRQDKSRLSAQLEMEKSRVQILEENKSSDTAQMEAVRLSMEQEISELKKNKMTVDNQLELERIKVDTEKKKMAVAQEQLREKELMIQASSKPSITPPCHSREGSIVGDSPLNTSLHSITASMALSQSEESMERSMWQSTTSTNKLNLYESLRQSNTTALVDHLQCQLKQREGEIYQLQSEISELEKTRESLAAELVKMSIERSEVEARLEALDGVHRLHQELDGRYQALLQMYGEKEERAQELELDLQDMKDMYRTQINELLKNK